MVVNEIRLPNARRLLDQECDGAPAAFARRIGRSDTQTNHLIGPNPSKNIGNKLARVIEEAFDKPNGWLDALHDDEMPAEVREIARAYAALPAARQMVVRELLASWQHETAPTISSSERDKKNHEEPQEH